MNGYNCVNGVRVKYHLSQSIQGALRNWKKKDWTEVAKANDTSPSKLKERFRIMDFEGKKFIPIGDCDSFSDQDGCPGHESPSLENQK